MPPERVGPQATIHLTYGPHAGEFGCRGPARTTWKGSSRALNEFSIHGRRMQASGLLPEPGQIHACIPSSPGHKVTLIKGTQSLGLANSYCGSCVWTLSQLTLEKAHAQRKEGGRGLAGGWDQCGPWWATLAQQFGCSGASQLSLVCLSLPLSSVLCSSTSHSLTACKENTTKHQKHRRGRKKRRGVGKQGRGMGRGQWRERRKEGAGRQALAFSQGLLSQRALSTWQASLTPGLPQARVDA